MAVPPSPPYIPAKHQGGHQASIDRIVIHGTVSRTYCGGAKAIARYFQDPTYVSSAHYVVDPCSEFQCVYDHTVAWHDGTNTNSIGIELCDLVEGPLSRWDDKPHQAMLVRAARLVRQLCLAYGIPMRKLTPAQIRAGQKGICGHADMRDAFPGSTSHWDPGAFPWGRFIGLVNQNGGGAAPGGDDMSEAAERDINAVHAGLFYGSTVGGKEWPSVLAILAETQRRVTVNTNLLARKNGIDAGDVAEALAPQLAAVLLPDLDAVMREALGADNAGQAEAIITALSQRLAEQTTEEGQTA